MRTSSLVLALPALTAAQQFPLLDQVKGFFAKASQSISSAVASATESISIPDPVAPVAAKLAELNVDKLTLDNHKELLKPGVATSNPGIETWLVFVTGANKTCYGLCAHSESAWNKSVPLISVAPSAPNLAVLNCETDGVLCHAWGVAPPKLLHFQLPQPLPDQSVASTTYRSIDFNRTTITASEIASLITEDKYLATKPYEGFFHPFDSPIAKAGLNIPLGWAIWGFSQIPSWAFMIVVSMASRTFMNPRGRRMPPSGERPAAAAAPASS